MKKYEYATIHIHFDSDEEGKAGTYRFFLNDKHNNWRTLIEGVKSRDLIETTLAALNDIGARGYQVIENKSNGGKQMVYMLMREVNQE